MTDDLKTLWRRQRSEGPGMDIESLRAGVRAQLARTRRARVLLVLATVIGVGLAGYQAVSAPTGLLRLGQGLLAAGFLIFLAQGWRRLAPASPDTAEACVAFLRKSLARRRDAARGGWIVLAAPLLPGMAVTLVALAVAAGADWLKLAPLAALFALWLAAMIAIQAREAGKVAVEIAQLDRQARG
jgi:hypothetical protein